MYMLNRDDFSPPAMQGSLDFNNTSRVSLLLLLFFLLAVLL